MRIIILGAPGAGKGTQGELLAKNLGLPRLSTGALLRRVWKKGSPPGQEIGQYMLKGLNVPAKVLFKVLAPWFANHKNGFIADNLPRNLDQLEEFKKFLPKTGTKIDKVFHLIVSSEEGIKRIIKRHQERLDRGDPRPDETPKIIRVRIEKGYKKEVKPVLDYFKKMGVLVEINGEQSIEKVHQDILAHLKLND